jgi:hypothetical protein
MIRIAVELPTLQKEQRSSALFPEPPEAQLANLLGRTCPLQGQHSSLGRGAASSYRKKQNVGPGLPPAGPMSDFSSPCPDQMTAIGTAGDRDG